MPEPIAITAKQISEYLPFAERSWRRLDASGQCPRGHKVAGRKVWRLSDLERWAAQGFPDRKAFEVNQAN